MTVHQRGTYSLVSHDVWTDEAVMDLAMPESKLLFLWSFTNGQAASLTGLTNVSPYGLCRALQMEAHVVQAALADLGRKPLVVYHAESEVLWCVNRAAYSMRSEKTVKSALTVLRSLPPTPILDQFRRRYSGAIGDAA